MKDKELEEIRNRVKVATAKPWRAFIEGREHDSGESFIMTGIKEGENIWNAWRGNDIYLTGTSDEDLDFIANARQDIPNLLDYISELKKEIEKLKK